MGHPEPKQVWEKSCPQSRGSVLSAEAGPQRPGRRENPGLLCSGPAPHTRLPHLWELGVSPSRDGSGLRCSTQVLVPPSCRKPEIREAELLHLLRAEPRLLKKTAAACDGGFQSLLLPPSPLECEDQILKETDSGVGALRGFPSARLATTGRIAFFRAWGFFPVFISLFLLLNIK